jgi:hypothetical protein
LSTQNSNTNAYISSGEDDGHSDIDSRVLDETIEDDYIATTKQQLRRAHGPANLKTSPIYPSITVWSLTHVHHRRSPQKRTELHPLKDGLAIALDVESMTPARIDAQAFRRDKRRERLAMMLARLDALGWERYDTAFASLLAHEQIIGKRSWVSGADVVRHLLLHVLQPDGQLAAPSVARVIRKSGGGEGGSGSSSDENEPNTLVAKM